MDRDNDSLPDWWEILNGLDPNDATGVNGADGDKDEDTMSNYKEFLANTAANDASDFLKIDINMNTDSDAEVSWPSKTDINYWVERKTDLSGSGWQSIYFTTALSNEASIVESIPASTTSWFYRVKVKL